MRKTENITGFIFKIISAKEADQVIHLLGSDGGRYVLYSKGSRKETSRKAHAVDLLNLVSIKIPAAGDIRYITELKLFQSIRSRVTELHGLVTIQFICELIDKFALIDEGQPQLFILIENILQWINNEDNQVLLAALMLKLLKLSGALPNLKVDVHSEAEITTETERFLAPEIGYNKRNVESGQYITDRIYKTQQFMINSSFEDIMRISLTPEEKRKLFNISNKWIEHFLEIELKMRALFLESL